MIEQIYPQCLSKMLIFINTELKKKKIDIQDQNGKLNTKILIILWNNKDNEELKIVKIKEIKVLIHILFIMNSFKQYIKEQQNKKFRC